MRKIFGNPPVPSPDTTGIKQGEVSSTHSPGSFQDTSDCLLRRGVVYYYVFSWIPLGYKRSPRLNHLFKLYSLPLYFLFS
jgi:hypothetical protein